MTLGILQMLVELVGHLAWPIVVFLIATELMTRFHEELRALVGRITSIEVPPAKVMLSTSTDGQPVTPEDEAGAIDDRQERTIRDNPIAAVIEAWIETERTIKSVSADVEEVSSRNRRTTPVDMMHVLLQADLISSADYDDLLELRRIRNTVVHEGPVSVDTETATLYVSRAARIRGVLEERAGHRADAMASNDPRK